MERLRWASLVLLAASCGPVVQDMGTAPPADCRRDDDCDADRYCDAGRCTAYGGARTQTPTCTRSVPTGAPSPELLCEWTGPAATDPYPQHRQVLSTPLVVDFAFDGVRAGRTPRPSIIINTYDGTDQDCGLGPAQDGSHHGVLRVLDGNTCQQQFVVPVPVNGAAAPAVGDLDGDGRPEIVALSSSGGVVALAYDPNAGRFLTRWTSQTATGATILPLLGKCEWTGPALHDLNDDGRPEILIEGFVLGPDGKLLDDSVGDLSDPSKAPRVGQFAVVSDMDGDGAPDLVTPRAAYTWQSGRWSRTQQYSGARGTFEFAAVADLGTVTTTGLARDRLDRQAEVVVASAGRAWALSRDGRMVFGPVPLGSPTGQGGGPPVVADFDNDGRAEIGVAAAGVFTVLDPDCAPGGDARTCPTGRQDGVLWSARTQEDNGSTGASAYDFDGDGALEAVYADECYARIYDGRSGAVLYSQPRSSHGYVDYPVVADVQGSYRARLVVPSNQVGGVACPPVDPSFAGLRCASAADCPGSLPCDAGYCRCNGDASCNPAGPRAQGLQCLAPPPGLSGSGRTCQAVSASPRAGVQVLSDVLDRWLGGRPVWNQHTYSVTNVNDDGSLPRTSGWARNVAQAGLNNYRAAVAAPGPQQAAADATVQAAATARCEASGAVLTVQVCNRGAAALPAGAAVNFYEGAARVCAATTGVGLLPGTCAAVTCAWSGGGLVGAHTLKVVAADSGAGVGRSDECNRDNNSASFTFSCGG